MADVQPFGWAVRRNGSCPVQEVDCGESIDPFHVCCPSGSQCPDQYNRACCPQGSGNCTETLVQKPRCANATWGLFTFGGYFCCDPSTSAFGDDNYVGCAQAGSSLPGGAVLLPPVASGAAAAAATASPTSTAPPNGATAGVSADSNKAASASSSGSSNVGAIAGGVTGGVIAGVLIVAGIWFWQRRSKAKKNAAVAQYQYFEKAPPRYEDNNLYGNYVPEVENKPVAPEADGVARAEFDGTARVEMGTGRATINELPASLPASPLR